MVFEKLRKGTKVKDIWYGNGIVVKKLKTRVDINLTSKGVWRYDKPHVETFIKIRGKNEKG